MHTYHKSNLACIMDLLGVTGVELGDFLHVDYSLISKWKNNKRKLTNRNIYIDKIVNYFISLDAPKDHQTLKLLLHNSSSENLDKILKHWLLSTKNEENKTRMDLLSTNATGIKYNAPISIYEGNKGRRSAVLNFLDAVLEIPNTPELFLLSQEDMSWLIEDPSFLLEWRDRLIKILHKGNKITIIHTVDRTSTPLVSILEHWLPLHLTGRITPLYYPKYTDITFKTTLFILKDYFVVTGLFVDGFSKEPYTTLLSDPVSLMQSEWIFQKFLSSSKNLYKPYYFEDFFELSQEIIKASTKEENSYLRAEMPLISLMPISDFKSLLKEESLEEDAIDKLLSYHQDIQKASCEILPLCYQRHIYSLETFDKIIKEGTPHYYELDMIKGICLKVPLKYFIKQLEAIIERLDQYPNYQIALTNRPLNKLDDINVWIKENTITFAYSATQPVNSSVYVSSAEPTVVNAFFQYYEDLWNSLPRTNKSKDWIKTKLQGLIQKAKDKEG